MNSRLEIVLIDDESKALKSLQWELQKFKDEVEIMGSFTDPGKALHYLRTAQPDCIFLDVEMPQMDGFEFLSYLKERKFEVVFVTAYDRFAFNAIKEDVVDYLLKPIDTEDLSTTLKKIKNRIGRKNGRERSEQAWSSDSNRRISIPLNGKIIFLDTDEITHCESDGNYCRIFLEDKKNLFVTKKLKEILELLPNDKFFRVHNSFVVNLKKVREFLRTEGYLVLVDQKRIPVSRNKRSSFLDKI